MLQRRAGPLPRQRVGAGSSLHHLPSRAQRKTRAEAVRSDGGECSSAAAATAVAGAAAATPTPTSGMRVRVAPLLTAALVASTGVQPPSGWAEPPPQPAPVQQQRGFVSRMQQLVKGGGDQAAPAPAAVPAAAAGPQAAAAATSGAPAVPATAAPKLASTPDARKREAAAAALQEVLGLSEEQAWAALAREQGLVPLGKRQMQVRAAAAVAAGCCVGAKHACASKRKLAGRQRLSA